MQNVSQRMMTIGLRLGPVLNRSDLFSHPARGLRTWVMVLVPIAVALLPPAELNGRGARDATKRPVAPHCEVA